KYTDCVVVCPVECFYEGESMLYIHPDECIDCEACVPECPVEAIFHEDNLPEEWRDYASLNKDLAAQCPVITETKEPLAGGGRGGTRRSTTQSGKAENPLPPSADAEWELELKKLVDEVQKSGVFDTDMLADLRRRVAKNVVLRDGQESFRKSLLRAYSC